MRKSGSSALEPRARLPSKKQIKRQTRENVRESLVVDKVKEKVKVKHMREQFKSDEMGEFIEDMRER